VAEHPPEFRGALPSRRWGAPRSTWAHVGPHQAASSVTVSELCQAVACQLPLLGMPSNSRVLPASLRRPGEPAEQILPQWLLHRDLRWTQAERLYVFEDSCPASKGSRRAVLFQRDSARPVQRLRESRLPGTRRRPAGATVASSCGDTHCRPEPSECRRREQRGPVLRLPQDMGEAIEVPLSQPVPHSRRLLLSSSAVRQFEFHPARSNTMLVGRKDGAVTVLDHEADMQTHSLDVDSYPILGLSWLHTHPQWAVVGASQSGAISLVRYDENRPGSMEQLKLEPFAHLSSLSVNCTDDYFMTSGFRVDLGFYDIATGRRLSTFRGMHQNFINILRFASRSPHLFATASFDHTCKVWDLREPISADQPAHFFSTETLNVMCCFSPDDRHVLCSGVDQALQQFSLMRQTDGSRFPLPSLGSDTNYRRSLYLADGRLICTAATNESLLRMYTAEAPHRHRGCIDFRSMLRQRCQPVRCAPGAAVEDAGSAGGEYVQSLRCHPRDPTLLAVLLSSCDPHPESFISTVRLWEAADVCVRSRGYSPEAGG